MDTLFDVLNSHSPTGSYTKSPIRLINIDEKEQLITTCVEYLQNLQLIDGTLLSTHPRKTFVNGFITASANVIAQARTILTERNDTRFILTYKFNQDHIETLFSKIRSMGGSNNNPDVVQFKRALKRLLVRQEVSPSPFANSVEFSSRETLEFMRVDENTGKDEASGMNPVQIPESVLQKPIEDIVEYIGEYNS